MIQCSICSKAEGEEKGFLGPDVYLCKSCTHKYFALIGFIIFGVISFIAFIIQIFI